ncbi:MAG: cytochrome P450, partial [Pseudomonadota bacterium]
MTERNPPDFMDPGLMQDPFAADAWAREHTPVLPVPGADTFLVFSYEHIAEVLRNPRTFSSRNEEMMLGRSVHDPACQAIYAEGWPQAETLLNNDPPEHTRFRKLVRAAFSPGRIKAMDGRIRAVIDELIDGFIDAGECEFIEAFAMPLPALIIAGQMGIPGADIYKVKVWSNAFIELIGSYLPHEQELAQAHRVVEFQRYLKERIDARREEPESDMLSALVHAEEEDEAPLNTAEILNVAQQL